MKPSPFSKLIDISKSIVTSKSAAVSMAVAGFALVAVEVKRHQLLAKAKGYVQAKVDELTAYVTKQAVKQAEAETGFPLAKNSRQNIFHRFVNFRSAKQKAQLGPLQAMLQQLASTKQAVELLLDDQPDSPARRYHGRLSFSAVDDEPVFVLKGYPLDDDEPTFADDQPLPPSQSIRFYFSFWFQWLRFFILAKRHTITFSLYDVAGITFDFNQDNLASSPYYLIVLVRRLS